MTIQEHLDRLFYRCRQVSPARLARIDRKILITYFNEWGLRNGAEIGVERGLYSEYILKTIPGSHLYCVDNWNPRRRGTPKYEDAVQRLSSLNAEIIKKTSMEAVQDIPDESLDFVYIDANHTFDYAMQDIIAWSKKVRTGGLVSGHDYYRFRGGGVVDAVDAYTRAHGIHQWFLTDEKTPTWFWLKKAEIYGKQV